MEKRTATPGIVAGILLTFTFLVLSGCFLHPNGHTVRVTSALSAGVLDTMKIGDVSYGSIEPGETTAYKSIQRAVEHAVTIGEATFEISTLRLDGFGMHSWTMTVSGTPTVMSFTLEED